MFVGITLFYKLKFDFEINLVDFFVFLLDFLQVLTQFRQFFQFEFTLWFYHLHEGWSVTGCFYSTTDTPVMRDSLPSAMLI